MMSGESLMDNKPAGWKMEYSGLLKALACMLTGSNLYRKEKQVRVTPELSGTVETNG